MIGLAFALGAAASLSDIRERIIPNAAVLALAACGLAFQLMRAVGAVPAWMPLSHALSELLAQPLPCIATAAGLLVAGAALELAWRRRKGEQGLGMGDIKLLAAWGAVLGADVVWAFAFACLGGAVFALVRNEKGFPMAPWLTLGCALVCAALLLIVPR